MYFTLCNICRLQIRTELFCSFSLAGSVASSAYLVNFQMEVWVNHLCLHITNRAFLGHSDFKNTIKAGGGGGGGGGGVINNRGKKLCIGSAVTII